MLSPPTALDQVPVKSYLPDGGVICFMPILFLSLFQMENFFEKYPDAGAGESSRSQSIEQVKTNIQWLKDNKEEIERWLDSWKGSSRFS